jgi:hypothetical protein
VVSGTGSIATRQRARDLVRSDPGSLAAGISGGYASRQRCQQPPRPGLEEAHEASRCLVVSGSVCHALWPLEFDGWDDMLEQVRPVHVAIYRIDVASTDSTTRTIDTSPLGLVVLCEGPNSQFAIPVRFPVWVVPVGTHMHDLSEIYQNKQGCTVLPRASNCRKKHRLGDEALVAPAPLRGFFAVEHEVRSLVLVGSKPLLVDVDHVHHRLKLVLVFVDE